MMIRPQLARYVATGQLGSIMACFRVTDAVASTREPAVDLNRGFARPKGIARSTRVVEMTAKRAD